MSGSQPQICGSPLRWAGGKRRLVPILRDVLPTEVGRLVEPFFGGGSVSFGLAARTAYGADTNAELVNFYEQCASRSESIIQAIRRFNDDRETYNAVRATVPGTKLQRAVRFLYLNRTSYFGLYRTNAQGRYNVPYGGGGRLNVDSLRTALAQLSEVLGRVSVVEANYLDLLADVQPSDVVFLDPPYGSKGDFPFRRYGSLLFSHADHRRLAGEAERCRALGATVLATLPPNSELLNAYPGWVVIAERRRGTNLAEVCISPNRMNSRSPASSGEWRLVNRPLDEYSDNPALTGTQ